MGTLPDGIILPDFARDDLAWSDIRVYNTQSAAADIIYPTLTGHLDIVMSVNTEVICSATAAPRELRIIWLDDAGNVVGLANTGEIYNASDERAVTFAFGLSAVVATGLHNSMAPLPPVLMQPGTKMFLQLDGAVAADSFLFATVIVIHVPTGPPRDNANADLPLTATPVI